MRKRKTSVEERSLFPIFDLYSGLESQWVGPLPIARPAPPVIDPPPALPVPISFASPGRKTPVPKPLAVATEPHMIAHKGGHRILVKPGDIMAAVRFA